MLKRLAVLLLVSSLSPTLATACTSWAASGSSCYSDATIVAKNRDASLYGLERLEIIKPKHGYNYLALSYNNDAHSKKYPYLAAGINQQGLTVVNNSAVTAPISHRDKIETITIRKILSHYKSVQQVLADQKKLFSTGLVNFLIIGDKQQIAMIEIGKHGKYQIKTRTNGTLDHTNDYQFKNMVELNEGRVKDNQDRKDRIDQLLREYPQPYSMRDFIQMSYDHNDTDINSVNRLFTVATWIVNIPKLGSPNIYVRFTNPGQNFNRFHITLNKSFWKHQGPLSNKAYGELSLRTHRIQNAYIKLLPKQHGIDKNKMTTANTDNL